MRTLATTELADCTSVLARFGFFALSLAAVGLRPFLAGIKPPFEVATCQPCWRFAVRLRSSLLRKSLGSCWALWLASFSLQVSGDFQPEMNLLPGDIKR
jgi:hypothetical protein